MTNRSTKDFVDTLTLEASDIIGIDGPCGAGKTTLASLIQETYDVEIIHLDDFFLPMELRTPDRLAEIGGNVHYERFLSEVIHGIQSKNSFTYRRFDCHTMAYCDTVTVQQNKPIIIEGAYSLRPDFHSIYTKKIFLTIDHATQKQRLIHRVGETRYKQFEELWIPKEIAYFETFHIQDCADILLSC